MLLSATDWGIAEDAESSPGLVLQPTANIVIVFGAREPLCCDALGWNAENARISRGDSGRDSEAVEALTLLPP